MESNYSKMLGFEKTGYIYILKGNQTLYDDYLRGSVARYHNIFKWYFVDGELPPDLPEGLEAVKLFKEDIMENDNKLRAKGLIEKKVNELLGGGTKFFGEIGTRYDLTLTCQAVFTKDGVYGSQNFHILRDKDGNTFTWNTSSRLLEIGKTYALRGTVKAHELYNGECQTVLTRCMGKEV